MPGYDFSNIAEMPPSTNPSSSAYSGAVIGAQIRLKIVTSAVTIPPSTPPIIHGIAACGVSECAIPHVQAAVATTHSSSTHGRLIHRALQGHRLAADGDLAAKCLLIQ